VLKKSFLQTPPTCTIWSYATTSNI